MSLSRIPSKQYPFWVLQIQPNNIAPTQLFVFSNCNWITILCVHLCELVSLSFVSGKVSVHIHLFFFRNCILFPLCVCAVCLILHMKESKFSVLCLFCKRLFQDIIITFAKSALADIAPTYLIQKLELNFSIVRTCVGVLVYVVLVLSTSTCM